ncbi:MAG: hypothetical protein ACT4PU_13530 [Planctomycetota bacterium]
MILALVLAVAGAVTAAPTEPAQSTLSLDGRWDLLLDHENIGLVSGWSDGEARPWADALKVPVPGPLELQAKAADFDGVAWFRRALPELPALGSGQRLLLEFEQANWRVDVWLDGQSLGRHDGADTPFRFDLSAHPRRPSHWLVVRCVDVGTRPIDGLVLLGLPAGREGSFPNYGGLTGAVRLRTVPRVEVLRHEAEILEDGTARLRLDLHNHEGGPRAVELSATLAGVEELTWSAELPSGPVTLRMPWPGLETLPRWSPAQPALHTGQLRLQDGERRDEHELRLGLRRFVIAGNRFLLDGQPVALRGVVYQPYYPRTLCLPPTPGFLRSELLAIRGAGFNLVRVTPRLAPALYALCDEIGLFVHAEPTLGAIQHEMPSTAAAVDAALVALGEAVVGHPSVVLVGLLDELGGQLHRRVQPLFERAAALCSERVLLDDSGGLSGSARYRNPGAAAALAYDDRHLAIPWPMSPEEVAALKALTPAQSADEQVSRLLYLSHISTAGMPAFRATLEGYGRQLSSPDARAVIDWLQSVSRPLAEHGLQSFIGDLDRLVSLGQLAQAHAARQSVAALLQNPAVAGFCLGPWRDNFWEEGGLVQAWGEPKPALRALAALLRAEEPAADSAALPVEQAQTAEPAPAVAPALAAALAPRETRAIAAGPRLGLSPAVDAVLAPLMVTVQDDVHSLARLVVRAAAPSDTNPDELPRTLALLSWVQSGGTLLLLSAPDAGSSVPIPFGLAGFGQVAELPLDLSARPALRESTHLIAREHSPLLDDLGSEQPFLEGLLAGVAPRHVLLQRGTPAAEVLLGAFSGTGEWLGGAVQAVPLGRGILVLCTLRFDEESLQDPLARRLLENLLRACAGLAGRRPASAPLTGLDTSPTFARDLSAALRRQAIFFGMAERLATPRLPGLRPERDELRDLALAIARKNAALEAALAGREDEARSVLALFDRDALTVDRENFVRAEVALAVAMEGQTLAEPLRRELAALHARAARMARLDVPVGAAEQLALALRSVPPRPAAPAPANPAPESPAPATAAPTSLPPAGSTLDEATPER